MSSSVVARWSSSAVALITFAGWSELLTGIPFPLRNVQTCWASFSLPEPSTNSQSPYAICETSGFCFMIVSANSQGVGGGGACAIVNPGGGVGEFWACCFTWSQPSVPPWYFL